MHWNKQGNIYQSSSQHPKLQTHASNPLAILQADNVYRIFYCGRDSANRSSVSFFDYDLHKMQIVNDHQLPVFEHGPAGSYYSNGVSLGCTYEVDGTKYLTFMGWQCPDGKHWRGDIGRLQLSADGTLILRDTRPFLGIDDYHDKVSLSYPWIIKLGDTYRMWYGSTICWDAGNGEMIHTINQASSSDGELWNREGLAIPYEIGVAQAFSRPSVIQIDNMFHMWFSYRSGTGEKYRIGYASSDDSINWRIANQESGISVSKEGWDSEMIEYPFVFRHDDTVYMLYNGNSHGKSGIGLAILQYD